MGDTVRERRNQSDGAGAPSPPVSSSVSAVVLTHRRPRLATAVVRSLIEREGLPPDRVVVVVNGSGGLEDPALESRVRLLRLPHNLGPAGGFGAGMEAVFADPSVDWAYLCEDDVGLFSLPSPRLADVVSRAECRSQTARKAGRCGCRFRATVRESRCPYRELRPTSRGAFRDWSRSTWPVGEPRCWRTARVRCRYPPGPLMVLRTRGLRLLLSGQAGWLRRAGRRRVGSGRGRSTDVRGPCRRSQPAPSDRRTRIVEVVLPRQEFHFPGAALRTPDVAPLAPGVLGPASAKGRGERGAKGHFARPLGWLPWTVRRKSGLRSNGRRACRRETRIPVLEMPDLPVSLEASRVLDR